MREIILRKAKEDIPLYLNDFEKFWSDSLENIEDDDLFDIYRATLVFKNYKIAFQVLKLEKFDLIIDEIFEDINSSFFLALMGLYRSAHMHLRSSIELTMQFIYFIHHPIEYGKWMDGEFVIKHYELSQYIQDHPFFDLDISQLLISITQMWRKCSKHIHRESPIFFQCEKDIRKTNSFSLKDYNIWKGNFLKNIYSLNKLFLLFFKNDLSRFPTKSNDLFFSILTAEDRKLFENKE